MAKEVKLPPDDEPCLVEIWQNYRGKKLVWYEVMVWLKGIRSWALFSDPARSLGEHQAAVRWVKISEINKSEWSEGIDLYND